MGSAVTWINDDPVNHTVVSYSGIFNSGILRPGGRFIFTFENPGTYAYYCSIHPTMRGQVNVVQAQSIGTTVIGTAQPYAIVPVIPDYSQFYTIAPGQAPATVFTTPEVYNILGQEPANIYLGGLQDQAIPYDQYVAAYSLLNSYSLWIQGSQAWVRYVQVPVGSSINLLAITPNGGNGTLYEAYPSGRTSQSVYDFFQYNRVVFYADRVGRHILFFMIGDIISNAVVVDVVGIQNTTQPAAINQGTANYQQLGQQPAGSQQVTSY